MNQEPHSNHSSPVSMPGGPLPPMKMAWWKRKEVYLPGIIVILLLIVGGAYAVMRSNSSSLGEKEEGGIFGSLPLSGDAEKRAEEEQKNKGMSGLSGVACAHPDRRAIGVMVAGDPINRPISGFAKADWVWELPVLVSDVTRLTAYYQCNEPGEIGSVRSVRHDYLFLADGLDAIVAHWGGSYHALNRIAAGEFQTLNALTNPFNAFFRKNNLPAPYNGFTSYDRLWNALEKLGYRTTTQFKGYDFKDDIAQGERPAGGTLSIAWPGAFRVSYEYDPTTNRYQRFWAGTRVVDGEDNKTPVAPSSVIVVRATNGPADGPGGYNDVGIEGEGDMTVYQDGKAIPGRWKKNELNKKDPMIFTNQQGQPIQFVRGQIWATAVEPDVNVAWAPKTAPAAQNAQ